jgi:hypothetical protein
MNDIEGWGRPEELGLRREGGPARVVALLLGTVGALLSRAALWNRRR